MIVTRNNIVISSSSGRDFLADAYYPEKGKNFPLLIFVHGYKGYKDWGAWHLMAKKFAEAGFYFVKFNFSHNGTTLENPTEFGNLEAFGHNNFSKEMLDWDSALNYFSTQPEVNSDKIAAMGHSRGAGITVVKALEDDRIKAVISLAGVSHFGYRFPTNERLEQWQENGVMYSENARTKQQMPHYYQFYEDYKENEQRFSVQYASQHLEKPFLILQGTEDQAVKDKEAFLLNEWSKGSELIILEGADHVFGAKEPWISEQLPEDLDKAVEHSIAFLKKELCNTL